MSSRERLILVKDCIAQPFAGSTEKFSNLRGARQIGARTLAKLHSFELDQAEHDFRIMNSELIVASLNVGLRQPQSPSLLPFTETLRN
jgi:hypothetical protein